MKFGESADLLSAIAARLLGWRPTEFWAATPAELVSALAEPTPWPPPREGEGMIGDELARLMRRFPDKEN